MMSACDAVPLSVVVALGICMIWLTGVVWWSLWQKMDRIAAQPHEGSKHP